MIAVCYVLYDDVHCVSRIVMCLAKNRSPHIRHREWQVVPPIPHPIPILRMTYEVACIIPNGATAFTVDVSEAGNVDDLKFAIKNRIAVALAAVDAFDLKLYQIDVDGFDSIVYIEEVQRLAENLGDLTRLNEVALLSSVIPPLGLPHGRDRKSVV